MWVRVCEFCGGRLDIDFKRCIKIKKISILAFKDGRYQLEFKNNNQEAVVCQHCAETHTIKGLWDKIEYHRKLIHEEDDENSTE